MNPQQRIQQIEAFLDALISSIQEDQKSGVSFSEQFYGTLAQLIESEMAELQQLRTQTVSQGPVIGSHGAPTEPTPETPGTAATPPTGGTPPPTPPTNERIPELDQAPFPSSNINSFKYNPNTRQLYIKFHGRDSADSGPTYLYEGIPENIYNVFHRGAVGPRTSGSNRYHTWHRNILPSLGASAYQLIREGGFQYQRVG